MEKNFKFEVNMARRNYLKDLLFFLDIVILLLGKSPAYRQRKADYIISQSSKNSKFLQRHKSLYPLSKTSLPDDKGNFQKKK